MALARIDPSWRRNPLTRTIVPFTSCAHDSPLRIVVLSIQIIVPATEKVMTGHEPLTATIAPSTCVSRFPAFVDAAVLVGAAGDDAVGAEIVASTSRAWQPQAVAATTVDHSRVFKGNLRVRQAYTIEQRSCHRSIVGIRRKTSVRPGSRHRRSTGICVPRRTALGQQVRVPRRSADTSALRWATFAS